MGLRRVHLVSISLCGVMASAWAAVDCSRRVARESASAPHRETVAGDAKVAMGSSGAWSEPTIGASPRVWGVTVDDVSDVDDVVESLRSLPARPMARVVFDEGRPAAHYLPAVTAIHRVAAVLGEILDSQYVARIDVAGYDARAREYMDALGDQVDVWEIGNEANGEWLGKTDDVVAKISAAFAAAKGRARAVALTLHFNEGCHAAPDHEMFRWAAEHVPPAMRDGLDYVLVSYYEDDCDDRQPDWAAQFPRLARAFPSSRVGFGECGTTHPERKAAYVRRYYGTKVPEPRFVGGYFWWYFREDMVPSSRPLWRTLADAIRAAGP